MLVYYQYSAKWHRISYVHFKKIVLSIVNFKYLEILPLTKGLKEMQRGKEQIFVGNAYICMIREVKETNQIWLLQLSRLQERGEQQK